MECRAAFIEPSMGSTTTWVVGLPPKRSFAQLLGNQVELVAVGVQALEQHDDGALGGGVDRGRLVAALTVSGDRLALDPAGQLDQHPLHLGDRVRRNQLQGSGPGITARVGG